MHQTHRRLAALLTAALLLTLATGTASARTAIGFPSQEVSDEPIGFYGEETAGGSGGELVASCEMTLDVEYEGGVLEVGPETTFATVTRASSACALGDATLLGPTLKIINLWLSTEGLPIVNPENIDGVLFEMRVVSFLVRTLLGDCLYQGSVNALAALVYTKKVGLLYFFDTLAWGILRTQSWLPRVRILSGVCWPFIAPGGWFRPASPMTWIWHK